MRLRASSESLSAQVRVRKGYRGVEAEAPVAQTELLPSAIRAINNSLEAKMALIVRLGKHTARFYRRTEQRVGDGTFKRVTVHLGSLPLTTTELPPDFPNGHPPLSDGEKSKMEEKFFAPARAEIERRRREEQEQKLNPVGRCKTAHDLLTEVAELSRERPVEHDALKQLLRVVLSVRSTNPLFLLEAVGDAAEAAATAADGGTFGSRGDEPMSDTPVAALWAAVTANVNGKGKTSLLRALQRRKFVKERLAEPSAKSE